MGFGTKSIHKYGTHMNWSCHADSKQWRCWELTYAHTHTCIYNYMYHTGAYGEWPGPGAEKARIPKTHLCNQATGTNESLSKMFLPFSRCSPSHSPFPVFSLSHSLSLSHTHFLSLSLAASLPPSLPPTESCWCVHAFAASPPPSRKIALSSLLSCYFTLILARFISHACSFPLFCALSFSRDRAHLGVWHEPLSLSLGFVILSCHTYLCMSHVTHMNKSCDA